MSSLVVGGVVIPVAVSSPAWSRSDAVDRGRMFDGTFFASEAGGATRDWTFSTPPVTQSAADDYIAALASPAAKLCSGDILQIPTMCSPELPSGKPTRAASSNRVVLDFMLHEIQPSKVLLRYAPGDTITGESFTASTTRTYRDINGLVGTAAIDVKRDAHYDFNDLVPNSASLLLEAAATNIALHCRDLANGAWTKSASMAAVRTSVGADGASNSATRLTASAADQTVSQVVVLASSARFMTADVRRITGTGTVEMTTDAAGADWVAIPLTAGYVRVQIPTKTLANPNFGFRIRTSGDAIDVDFVQNETGTFPTSRIPTTTVAVTRAADLHSLPFTIPPQEMTVYVKFIERGTISTPNGTQFLIGNSASAAPLLAAYSPATPYTALHSTSADDVASVLAASPAYNDTVELCVRLFGDGSDDITQSINGGAATAGAQSAANALAAAWSGLLFWPNSSSGGVRGFTAIKSIKIVAGARSLAEMRSL